MVRNSLTLPDRFFHSPLSLSLSTLIYDSFQVFTPICAAFYDTIQKNSHGHLHKLVIEANETERKR